MTAPEQTAPVQWTTETQLVAQVPAGRARIMPFQRFDGSPAWCLIISAAGRDLQQLVLATLPKAMEAAELAPPATLRDRVLSEISRTPQEVL